MNPARTLGPAVFCGERSFFWLYRLGPIFGASLGGFVYQGVQRGGVRVNAKGYREDVHRIPVDGLAL